MFEIWIATWVMFNWHPYQGFYIAKSSSEALGYVADVCSNDDYCGNGGITLQHVVVKKDKKGKVTKFHFETKNFQIEKIRNTKAKEIK